jgi:hypothetical protein
MGKINIEIEKLINSDIASANSEVKNGNLIKACALCNEAIVKIRKLKENYIRNGDEENANRLLASEFMVEGLKNEYLCADADSQRKPGKAWDYLQNALNNFYWAKKIYPKLSGVSLHIEHCEKMEKAFPQQLFLSPAFITKRIECSICGKDYKSCEHIAGRAYMGKLAGKVYKDRIVREISIVTEPKDKRCRLKSIRLNNGTFSDPHVGLFYPKDIFQKLKKALMESKSTSINPKKDIKD